MIVNLCRLTKVTTSFLNLFKLTIMKINFLLIAIIIATISSCSTSYKTGQTPDDVYYSPARYEYDSVRTEREDNAVYENSEDREIRRRVHNRRYRRYDDRYDYPYDTYNNYPYGYNRYPPVYGNPKLGAPQNTTQPRKTNLGAYQPNPSANDSSGSYNPKLGRVNNTGTNNPVRTFGNPPNSSSSNGSGVGNFIRKVFTGNNNTYNSGSSNNSSPARTFERSSPPEKINNNSSNNSGSSNSSSSSSDNKSGGSAPVRRF